MQGANILFCGLMLLKKLDTTLSKCNLLDSVQYKNYGINNLKALEVWQCCIEKQKAKFKGLG